MSGPTKIVYWHSRRAFVVESDDPAVPEATITGSLAERLEGGRHATCPKCDARLRLEEETDEGIPTGIEYQLHYVNEHLRPEERYEETAQ